MKILVTAANKCKYSKSECINAIQDAYGKNKGEAEKYYRNADGKTLEALVDGFKQNARKSFITDSKQIKASVFDDSVVWSSKAAEDWVYGLSDEEVLNECLSSYEFYGDLDSYYEYGDIDPDSDGSDDHDVTHWDIDGLRGRLLPGDDYDPDYEELEYNIIPAIEKQCYDNEIWFVGNYQRWDGGHDALGYFDDVEKGILKVCYPNYDSTATLYYDDDGNLTFTESSHDAPMGGTAMTLYSFKDKAAYDAADDYQASIEEDGSVDYSKEYGPDVKVWIEKGWFTPIKKLDF